MVAVALRGFTLVVAAAVSVRLLPVPVAACESTKVVALVIDATVVVAMAVSTGAAA